MHRLDMDDELAGALASALDLAVRHIGLSLNQAGADFMGDAARRLDAIQRITAAIQEVSDDQVQHLDQ